MSSYMMYRCDGCGFEDEDSAFLAAETASGEEEFCFDCDEKRRAAQPGPTADDPR